MCSPIRYPLFDELPQLVADKLVSARPHPKLPLTIYNYTAGAQSLKPAEWPQALRECRGLILDREGFIVGRPFAKFWNYSQLPAIPDGPFTVQEKLDGSLGIVTSYAGERVVATRGSFESGQAVWLCRWFDTHRPLFLPSGETWLYEIVFPGNRIVVDYGARAEPVLLAVMAPNGVELRYLFESANGFTKARRFDGVTDFSKINSDPQFAGEEGFVVKWLDGTLAKLKLDEYVRLHKLITQCSTRTIWELLRSGKGVEELLERVPAEFAEWVIECATDLLAAKAMAQIWAVHLVASNRDRLTTRKEFALWAKKQPESHLLFLLLDGKSIEDACWKLVEPAFSTPFRKESEDA